MADPTDPPGGGKLTPEQANKLRTETRLIELKEKFLELTREEQNLLLLNTDLTKETKASLEFALVMMTKTLEMYEEQAKKARNLLEVYAKHTDTVRTNMLYQGQLLETMEKELRARQELLKSGAEISDAYMRDLETLEKDVELQRQKVDVLNKIGVNIKEAAGYAKDFGTEMGGLFKVADQNKFFNVGNFMKLQKSLRAGKASAYGFMDAFSTSVITNMIDSIIGLAFEIDRTTSGFIQSTGASREFTAEMTEVYDSVRASTIAMDKHFEAMQGLYTTYTDFTMLSGGARDEVAETVAILTRWGLSGQEAGQGMQVATKMLGQGAIEGAKSLREIEALAEDLQVAPQMLISQFGTMGVRLAKLGEDGTKAFKDLARVAKITGLEIDKLMNITDKFDTFEGAAEQAGKLNAALGGNFVNAMDLMMATDPVERFDMIRGAIEDAGLSFDDMSYFQRKFYADSLGLDSVGDLALMLAGDMSALDDEIGMTTSDYELMAERAREAASVQDQWKALLHSMIPIAQSFLEKLQGITTWVTKHNELFKKYGWVLGVVLLAYKGLRIAMALQIRQAQLSAATSLEQIAANQGVALTEAEKTAALTASTQAQWASNAAVAAGALKIAAFGLAIGAAAFGIGTMVSAFKDFSWEDLSVMTATLTLLGLAIWKLSPALSTLAGAATTGALGLGIIAAVFFAVGAGIGMATAGLSMLIDSFDIIEDIGLGMFAQGLLSVAASIWALSAASAALASPISLAGLAALASLGLAAVGIGKLMSVFKKDKDQIQDMEGVFKNFGEVDTAQFEKGTQAFAAMKQSINEMSGFKLGALAVTSRTLPAITAPTRAPATPIADVGGWRTPGGGGDAPVTITLDTSETRKFWEAIIKGPIRLQGNKVVDRVGGRG